MDKMNENKSQAASADPPANPLAAEPVTKKPVSYWINVVVGLVIMFGFRFLPAPEPITTAGMAAFGCFLGLVYLIVTVDMIWPAFASILAFSFCAKDIYPASVQENGLFEAVVKSTGQWITTFLIVMFLLSYALEKTGILRRVVLWFVTRKLAKKGPWGFTFMFLLAALVIGCVIDGAPAGVVMVLCAREIIKALGFKKGDSWPCMLICSVVITVELAFGISPIGHNLPIAVVGMVSGATGQSISILSYLLTGIPLGLLFWALMFLYFKFIVKPDVSHFKEIDYNVIENMRPGRMGMAEKITAIVSVVVLIWWVLPGFLSIFAPDAPFTLLLNEMSLLFPVIAAVIVLAIIRVDGKPILNIAEAAKEINWTVIFMFMGIILCSLALMHDTTGFPQWIAATFSPLIDGLPPYVTVMIICLVSVILTNILNNWAVGVVFATVGASIAAQIGVDPTIVAVGVGICCNMAFTTPAASPYIAFSAGDPYCSPGYVLRHGLVMMVLACIVFGVLLYPFGTLVY